MLYIGHGEYIDEVINAWVFLNYSGARPRAAPKVYAFGHKQQWFLSTDDQMLSDGSSHLSE